MSNSKKILNGEKRLSDFKINKIIDELVNEVSINEEFILKLQKEDGKSNSLQKEDHYKNLLNLTGIFRGRSLFYDYLGSGAGKGPYVELMDGSFKLDLINGIGVNLFGHSHPEIIKTAIQAALSDTIMQGHLQPNVEYYHLVKKVTNLAGKNSNLKKVWLTTCGSMANENALKIIRQKKSPAKLIIAFEKSFAGRTTMMTEISDNPDYKQGLPGYDEILRIPFYDSNDNRSIEKCLIKLRGHINNHPNEIAAFMFEPIQGEGGFRLAPRDFFVQIIEICKENNIAIWIDEIQTFLRSGEAFCFEALELGKYIDVCTIAKTLQVGATLFTEDFNPKPGLIAGTFAGSTTSLMVGGKVLDIITNGKYFGSKGMIAELHKNFIDMLESLIDGNLKGYLKEAGGKGLMISAIAFNGDKEKTIKLLYKLFENGLIAFFCGRNPTKLRFLLPVVLNSNDIEFARKIIEKSFYELINEKDKKKDKIK